jgi:hypothetical protein
MIEHYDPSCMKFIKTRNKFQNIWCTFGKET